MASINEQYKKGEVEGVYELNDSSPSTPPDRGQVSGRYHGTDQDASDMSRLGKKQQFQVRHLMMMHNLFYGCVVI